MQGSQQQLSEKCGERHGDSSSCLRPITSRSIGIVSSLPREPELTVSTLSSDETINPLPFLSKLLSSWSDMLDEGRFTMTRTGHIFHD